ncbi:MAG: hypothetical protein K5663_10950 [Clostridiales bacterium]|nr:hypothetical protein [Clostridiales bacterium]
MHENKARIYDTLAEMMKANLRKRDALGKSASLEAYRGLVREEQQNGDSILIWTRALQTALSENEVVLIPGSGEPYYIDSPVVIPSNRHIIAAENAVIRLKAGVKTLMFRNEHTKDGTHAPIPDHARDDNISISGGIWEESIDHRAGYGKSGMIDEQRSFFGVSTAMFFNNLNGLTLMNMTFRHTAGFAVQTGDISNVVIHNITFEECYADGLHLNGNMKNAWIKDVRGQCGDDLVALNAYDWKNSSVDFGPMECVLCEDLVLSESSPYKAMRIQPGIYYYADFSAVDCALNGVIVKNVRGIRTFKMYYQTPAYRVFEEEPEKGAPGSGDWIFFEDIAVDLAAPLDLFREYTQSDPVRGAFAAFEIGANIGHLFLENIDLKLYRDKYPLSYLLCAGPKSCVYDSGRVEVFDPYVSCKVDSVCLSGIRVNGQTPEAIEPFIRTTEFNDINHDNRSTGRGTIENIAYEPRQI